MTPIEGWFGNLRKPAPTAQLAVRAGVNDHLCLAAWSAWVALVVGLRQISPFAAKLIPPFLAEVS